MIPKLGTDPTPEEMKDWLYKKRARVAEILSAISPKTEKTSEMLDDLITNLKDIADSELEVDAAIKIGQKGIMKMTEFMDRLMGAVSLSKIYGVDFPKTGNEILPFKVSRLQEIETKPVQWQIKDILIENAITLISGQPGSFKTWLALELGLCVASGRKAFGVFETQVPGRVLFYNAEDDPSTITKCRLEAMMRGKGVKDLAAEKLEFLFITEVSFYLDNKKHQEQLDKTLEAYKPSLLILDPFRNLHVQNENQSTDIVPILNFLREMNRKHSTAIIIVTHDKKPSGDSNERRASRMRGSNALEGFRDSYFMLDAEGDSIKVQFYHRAARPRDPISFTLVSDERDEQLYFAQLNLTDSGHSEIEKLVIGEVAQNPGQSMSTVAQKIHKQKGTVSRVVNGLLDKRVLIKKSGSQGLFFESGSGTGSVVVEENT